MKRKSYLYLLAIALFTIVTVVIITTQHAVAKDGIIVGGNNGTKWCCPDGVKSDKCVQGNSSIPLQKKCNFANMVKPLDATPNLGADEPAPINPITSPVTAPSLSAAPGTPIGGIIVKGGKNPGGQMLVIATTDSDGKFAIDFAEGGEYKLAFEQGQDSQDFDDRVRSRL